jgi:hypothetical protein
MTTLVALLNELCDTHELDNSLTNTSQIHKVSKLLAVGVEKHRPHIRWLNRVGIYFSHVTNGGC